jgi:hypothetical protein
MVTTAMRQMVGAVVSCLLVLGVVAVAQPPKTVTEPTKTSDKKADPERMSFEKMDDLPEVKVQADDSAEVKATKERFLAAKKKCMLLYVRIAAGQFTGVAGHTKLGNSLRDLTDAAQEVYSAPKDQLPWFEFRLAVTKEALGVLSVEGGRHLDESETLYWEGERMKAELALVKVQKKAKK